MTVTATGRCLLILPKSFYSFTAVIERGLQDMGFETVVANDEYPYGLFGRVLGRLGLRVSRLLTRRALNSQFLAGQSYELILIIKGRGLDHDMVTQLRAHGRSVIGYHFDSFGYDSGPARWCKSLPRVCTFDYRDAQVRGLPLVELFSALPAQPSALPRRYRISAIMRNHSQRLLYLDTVMRALGTQGSFIYILEANLFTFIANLARHPLLYIKYRRFISRKPLPYAQYVQVLADSAFTLDYAHPKQTGITLRCFEAASVGTRVITNNSHVLKSPLFDETQVIVHAPDANANNLPARVAALAQQPVRARQRSVQDFLLDLLGPRAGAPVRSTG